MLLYLRPVVYLLPSNQVLPGHIQTAQNEASGFPHRGYHVIPDKAPPDSRHICRIATRRLSLFNFSSFHFPFYPFFHLFNLSPIFLARTIANFGTDIDGTTRESLEFRCIRRE